MGESAGVESIDALRMFRAAVFKFQESANIALAEAEGELNSTLNWLEHEQSRHWSGQIRKRHDLLERAKEALRMKQIFKDATGRQVQAVEEQKAVRVAQVRLAEADEKLKNVKKYSRVLVREIQVYKGSVQRFATTVQSELPVAASQLSLMIETLEQYAATPVGVELAPTVPTETHSSSEAADGSL